MNHLQKPYTLYLNENKLDTGLKPGVTNLLVNCESIL